MTTFIDRIEERTNNQFAYEMSLGILVTAIFIGMVYCLTSLL